MGPLSQPGTYRKLSPRLSLWGDQPLKNSRLAAGALVDLASHQVETYCAAKPTLVGFDVPERRGLVDDGLGELLPKDFDDPWRCISALHMPHAQPASLTVGAAATRCRFAPRRSQARRSA